MVWSFISFYFASLQRHPYLTPPPPFPQSIVNSRLLLYHLICPVCRHTKRLCSNWKLSIKLRKKTWLKHTKKRLTRTLLTILQNARYVANAHALKIPQAIGHSWRPAATSVLRRLTDYRLTATAWLFVVIYNYVCMKWNMMDYTWNSHQFWAPAIFSEV